MTHVFVFSHQHELYSQHTNKKVPVDDPLLIFQNKEKKNLNVLELFCYNDTIGVLESTDMSVNGS